MSGIPYSVVAGGNSDFVRSFSIPLAEELESIEGLEYQALPDIEVFVHDTRHRAFDIPIEGLFGVLLFLPGWLTLKALNELYDIKIRPAVRQIIRKADEVEVFSSNKKHKAFVFSVFHEESNVIVILAAKEKSLRQLETSSAKLPTLLPSALETIRSNGSSDEVHLYVLSDGKVNVEPYIHPNLESASDQLNTQ